MAFRSLNNDRLPSLSLNTTPDSPGSSIFDLPTHNSPSKPFSSRTLISHPVINVEHANNRSFVVISGGTGGNTICAAFGDACHVLPVSDDGGSSSEIIRVLGGPSIGDIRSRLIRLIPSAPESSPLSAIRRLLAYRLPTQCTVKEARDEWRDIVEGRSRLWSGISNDKKEAIRGFLVYFEGEVLKRAQKNFDFRNGSIGNYFLAAAQLFFRSLPSAIFLFSSITKSQATILPVIVTNHTVTIAAELENGARLVGQCQISHPVQQTTTVDATAEEELSPIDGLGERVAQQQNVMFEQRTKDYFESLPARITRLYYMNAYGMEIHPSPNPEYLTNLAERDVLVYSCGSLWTSIIPCLALKDVATAIACSPRLRVKVLLLNTENDRETEGYTAVDYIMTIVQTLNTSYQTPPYGLGNVNTTYPVSAFVTDLVYLQGGKVHVDTKFITSLGVRCTKIDQEAWPDDNRAPRFGAEGVRQAIDKILNELES